MKNPYTIVFEINGYAIFALPLFDEFIEGNYYEWSSYNSLNLKILSRLSGL